MKKASENETKFLKPPLSKGKQEEKTPVSGPQLHRDLVELDRGIPQALMRSCYL
jgi:hypothetical protein